MNATHFSLALVVLVLMLGVEGRADSTPATRPSPGTLGDVRIQTLRPYSYAFISTQTTLNKEVDAIDKEFTLDIGVIVKDGTPKPDGFQMITVGSSSCATVIYAGDLSQLGHAWGKLYGEIGRRGLQPTDVCREVFLYWEGRESANNLIQLQAELSPSN